MQQDDRERVYGLGLKRDAHIAFASAYIAVLLTIGGFGAAHYVASLPAWNLFGSTASSQKPAAPAPRPAPVAFRAHPVPDPASPHVITVYPQVALLNHQQGVVVLRLLILQSGLVGDVQVLKSSGYPQLDAAALVETGYWRYLPAVRDGKPVAAQAIVTIHFKLNA